MTTPSQEFWQRFLAAKSFAAKRNEFNRFFYPGSNQQKMLLLALIELGFLTWAVAVIRANNA